MKYPKTCISITMNKIHKLCTYMKFLLAFYKKLQLHIISKVYCIINLLKARSQLL